MVDIYIGQDKLITAYLMNALKVLIDSFYDSFGTLIGYLIQITKRILFQEKLLEDVVLQAEKLEFMCLKIEFHRMSNGQTVLVKAASPVNSSSRPYRIIHQ